MGTGHLQVHSQPELLLQGALTCQGSVIIRELLPGAPKPDVDVGVLGVDAEGLHQPQLEVPQRVAGAHLHLSFPSSGPL